MSAEITASSLFITYESIMLILREDETEVRIRKIPGFIDLK